MLGAWLVHLFTASGVVLAFLSVRSIIEYDYRTAFFWLWLQVVIDAVDGTLARRARVSDRVPAFSGEKLDDLIDYLTYVFVPALCVWRGLIVPDAWALIIALAMLLSSLFGFSRVKAKTPDHFFTGFPSYWNVVVFYLLICGFPLMVNVVILLVLAVMVFVPIRYVYPSRMTRFRRTTLVLGSIWGVLMLLMLWQYPAVSRPVVWVSLAFPTYYFALSFVFHFRLARPPKTASKL